MAKVTKAVIPVGGYGTRFLPATKAVPKELLPLVDQPALQYVVEEAVASGVQDILFVTTRLKRHIEDHFDNVPELEAALRDSGKEDVADRIAALGDLANFHYVRQPEMRGIGYAILLSRQHVGNEPFAVMFGDDVMAGAEPALAALVRGYEETGASCVLVQEVAERDVHRYGIVEPAEGDTSERFRVRSLVEKPSPERAPSRFGVIGRYVLDPAVFDYLADAKPGVAGEIQLTDALDALAKEHDLFAVRSHGERFDIGEPLGYLRAQLIMALMREDLKHDVRELLREVLKTPLA